MSGHVNDSAQLRTASSIAPLIASVPPVSSTGGWIGDWLLTFGETAAPLPARTPGASWQPEISGGVWQAWTTPTGAGWRGAPTVTVMTTEWSARLIGELYGVAAQAASVADVVEGRAPADTLNGHFLLVACHRPSGEWHVWTNRHATFHAYWAGDGARTAVGTFLPAVAAATGRAELNWEGLASFFRFGFFAADWTHLAGARILRPATHYHFDGRGRLLAEERYWRWWHAPDVSRSYDETVEEFAGLLAAVSADLLANDRVAMPISGGLDSRSMVATVQRDAPSTGKLWAYSYGYSDQSVETRIAAQVAAARGLQFTPFTIRPYLFEKLPGIMAAVEGFEDVTLCRQAAVVEAIDDHADFLIGAHGGDLYLNVMGVNPGIDSAGGLAPFAMKKFVKGGSQWLLDNLCRPNMGAMDPQPMLDGVVIAELERFDPVDDPDFRLKMLKTDQWVSRWTAVALRVFQGAAFPRLPFYDIRMLDFFCTVPTSYLSGRQLQIDYLKRHAPDLARVPWQATGHDLFYSGQTSMWDLARRATRKGLRYLSKQKIRELNWEVQLMNRYGRDGLAYWLLRPGLALHEFVSPAAVRALLNAFRRDPYGEKRGYTVAMLLTFSAWLELQWGGGTA